MPYDYNDLRYIKILGKNMKNVKQWGFFETIFKAK